MRAEPSGDDAGFKLTELRTAAGENAVDRRHAAAQLVGVLSWLIVDRRIELIVSPAPVSASMRNENQKTWEPANSIVVTP